MIDGLLIVVMSGGGPPARELALWLSRIGCPWRFGSAEYGIDVARNQNVRRFLREDVPAGKLHLLMIDDDMVPVEATRPILDEPGDLLYCGYAGRSGSRGHYGQDDFGEGCFRASAGLLGKMADPWFATTYYQGRRVACEGLHFQRHARAAGVHPRMVGIVGHAQRCILLPAESKLGWQLAWPFDLAE